MRPEKQALIRCAGSHGRARAPAPQALEGTHSSVYPTIDWFGWQVQLLVVVGRCALATALRILVSSRQLLHQEDCGASAASVLSAVKFVALVGLWIWAMQSRVAMENLPSVERVDGPDKSRPNSD